MQQQARGAALSLVPIAEQQVGQCAATLGRQKQQRKRQQQGQRERQRADRSERRNKRRRQQQRQWWQQSQWQRSPSTLASGRFQ